MKKIWWPNLLLAVLAIISFALAYQLPMWSFQFKAPQYPLGLELKVFLTGTQGDVSEIDIINHYIGMQKLELAAQKERAIAPFVLAGLSFLTLLIAFFPGKKIMRWLALPILGFPVGFVSVFWLWLYKFGHDLDPAAPVDLIPFTPTILGTGIIGQFKTFAQPGLGFYLICLSALLVLIILIQDSRQAVLK